MPAKLLSGRPLYATAADAELFVPCEDVVDRIERSIERELNTLVVGARGAGKSSLLQHLLFRAREKGDARTAVLVDASIARSAMDVVDLIRDQLGVPRHLGEDLAAGFRAVTSPGAPGARASSALLARLEPLRGVADATVLLDGLADAEVAHTLFGRLRDELWALPITWVVAADEEHRAQFLVPPADAFFETLVELRPLEAAQQRELLRRRLPDEWRAVTKLVSDEPTTPRRLLTAARETLVGHRAVEEVLRDQAVRENLAASLGRSASMVLTELESLGRPVAASDEELLRRLGVTRERAGQVLNQLEARGLVASFSEQTARGRPRKLYRVRKELPPELKERK